jgi:hypothetical protein
VRARRPARVARARRASGRDRRAWQTWRARRGGRASCRRRATAEIKKARDDVDPAKVTQLARATREALTGLLECCDSFSACT